VVRLRPAHGEEATRTPLIDIKAGKQKRLTEGVNICRRPRWELQAEETTFASLGATSFAKEWEGHCLVVGATRIARF
jgi:hypothetical protein